MGDVEVRVLRTLVALATEGSMRGAAQKLHLTQPALSKQLAQAEQATGLQLFTRSARGLRPTPAGRVLLERARAILREVDNFSATAARERRRVSGHLTIGFIAQAANEHTAEIVREFRQRHADVTVEMRQYPMSDLSAGLAAGETDMAFLRHPVGTENLVHEPVLVEPRVAVLDSKHRLASAASIGVAELFGDPWVVSASPDPLWQRYALASDHRHGRPPVLGPTVRSVDEYLEAVRSGGAVGLAPLSARRFYSRPGVSYVLVRDADPSLCTLSWRADTELRATGRALLDVVRATLPVRADADEPAAGGVAGPRPLPPP